MEMKVKGIASYPALLEAREYKKTGKFSYSIDVLIHKSDPQCAAINKELREAAANTFPAENADNLINCWKDCAVENSDIEELKDFMVLKTSTGDKFKPAFVDKEMLPIKDKSVEMGLRGNVVWVSVNISSFKEPYHGVKAYLNGVLDTGLQGDISSEFFSSKPTAATMFADVAEVSPAANMFAPVANAPAAPAAPAAPTAPPAAPPVAPALPKHQMTLTATNTYEEYIKSGWTDDMLIENGLMLPPNGVIPSF